MYYREEGASFIRIGNLTREHINLRLDDLVFVQPPISAEGHRTCVAANDILISITADLGIIGVVPFGFGEGYVNQHIALVRPTHEAICSRFVGWFLSSHKGQSQFAKLNESGAKSGLNLPTVCSLLFPKPAHAEQERITESWTKVSEGWIISN
jgi:type I restriction enzyme S subunit